MPVQDRAGHEGRVGPFVTFVERVRPDGVVARWESRRHRKHPQDAPASRLDLVGPQGPGMVDRCPVRRGVAALRGRRRARIRERCRDPLGRRDVLRRPPFFTAAGFLTYREAVDAGPISRVPPGGASSSSSPAGSTGWATAVQLAGTLFFNISTGNALRVDLTAQAAHQHVWRPDAVGSICFLVASALAWFEVCHGWLAWRPRSWSWWITLANLIGSIAFGVSAVAGYISPATGQLRNAERSNLGTLVGAVLFLVGALLLLPERTEEASPAVTTPGASGT